MLCDSPGRGIGPPQRPVLVQHEIRKRQTSIPPAGFEPTTPEIYRPQAYANGRATTGAGENTFDMFILLLCALINRIVDAEREGGLCLRNFRQNWKRN